MQIVDSHAHLDMEDFRPDLREVLTRAERAGVKAIVTVGIDVRSSEEAVDLSGRYQNIFAAVGIHPHSAKGVGVKELSTIKGLSGSKKVVAYGEIGLDFFKNYSPRKDQIRVFNEQLNLAQELGLPLIIHERAAQKEVYETLKAIGPRERQGVIHCFSGDLKLARDYIALGFMISIPGIVTFKKAETLKEVARKIPLDSLLLETDCPFLAPEPHRGKRNEPAMVSYTLKEVSRLRGISPEELAYATTRNAIRLFGLSAPDAI